MVQAHELRIGNMVEYNSIFYEVWSIDKDYLELDSEAADSHADNIKTLSANPIPLTPEILEKYGFDYDASYDVPKVQKGNLVLFGYENEFGANFGHVTQLDVHVKYLHQLQNLYFALTGEELTPTPSSPKKVD